MLLVTGLSGAGLSAWSLRDSASSSRMAESLGMSRAANHWDGILSILAVPVLMFCTVIAVWSAIELHRAYRRANDPAAGRHDRGR